MPALNFQERFAPSVESGEKRQTIRKHRKRPFVVGDTLIFYTGQRTPRCRKLADAVAVSAVDIEIRPHEVEVDNGGWLETFVAPDDLDTFARADGFTDWEEMVSWFEQNHGLPFNGQLIRWQLVPQEVR